MFGVGLVLAGEEILGELAGENLGLAPERRGRLVDEVELGKRNARDYGGAEHQ